jgi:hypothetical protein
MVINLEKYAILHPQKTLLTDLILNSIILPNGKGVKGSSE